MADVKAKYIRTEKFSNRNFYIEIELYEHNLAKGHCVCKRRGVEYKMERFSSPILYFPSYSWIAIMEYKEFYGCFAGDKTARRWVRRVMQHCLKGFLHPNGEIDHTQFAIENDRRKKRSREYYRMNASQLLTMKRLLPEFFYPGMFRTDNVPYTNGVIEASSKEKYISVPAEVLNHPVRYRKFVQGRMHCWDKKYIPVERLREFIKEFDPAFCKQMCEERTMNDCNIEVEYRFPNGAIPEMRIFVQDEHFDEPVLPNS